MVNGTRFRVMRDMVYMVPGTLLPVKVPCSVVNSTAKNKKLQRHRERSHGLP